MIEMEKTVYVCELCGAEYDLSGTAEACERFHRTALDVVDMKFEQRDEDDPDYWEYEGFPQLIVIEDTKRSGKLAEYKLVREGSVEEFEPYNSPAFYEMDWAGDVD